MPPRAIDPRIDALFVEGPDDGAMVNALVRKSLGIELAKRPYLVRTSDEGGGANWARAEFARHVAQAQVGARVGLIVDRDGEQGRPDQWPAIRGQLTQLGASVDVPADAGHIVADGRFGIWMWPDNVSTGDLEHFVAGLIGQSPLLDYAVGASRVAKETHGAEYDVGHARKAALKVRSVWRDASAAGGYGHLLRNLPLAESPASQAFLAWFRELFLQSVA